MISIIIPVYNEATTIKDLLIYLIENSSNDLISEICVVDGGSTDKTNEFIKEITREHHIVRQISSQKGRAKQMNTGVKFSKGSILYFLHADSFPPENFDKLILNEVNRGNLAGCFKMRFDHSHWWLKLASWLTHFNWRACRGGDQSLFVTRELFNEIGGYDEDFVIFEDQILIKELFKRKKFVVIQKWITTSARLYERIGIWKLQYHFWTIYIKRWFGASADNIYLYYKRHISR